ncbi:MAG: hypothetical protein CML06_14265 [Pseudomonadales bacterium]|nr:hypothetical protein [Pseudomonadales bacterium]
MILSRVFMLLGAVATPLLLVANVAVAGVYRWVDESGQVHFSDQAPPQVRAERLDIPPAEPATGAPEESAAERLQRQKRLVNMLEEERLAREQAKAEQLARAREQALHCERFRNRLSYLERYNRFYDENEDGTRDYLTDEEADAFRARLKQQYRDECGDL